MAAAIDLATALAAVVGAARAREDDGGVAAGDARGNDDHEQRALSTSDAS